MGKKSSKNTPKSGNKGWKVDSKDGKFLIKLIKDGKVSPGISPGAIKEIHPRFYKYKNDSFASGLRRLKTKYGANTRGATGKYLTVVSVAFTVIHLL